LRTTSRIAANQIVTAKGDRSMTVPVRSPSCRLQPAHSQRRRRTSNQPRRWPQWGQLHELRQHFTAAAQRAWQPLLSAILQRVQALTTTSPAP
jgi:hypothetical protein